MTTRNLELYEAFALDALSKCAAPITLEQLLEIADPRNRENLDRTRMIRTLISLREESFVKAHGDGSSVRRHSITALGRARYSGCSPFSELHASASPEANGVMVDEMRDGEKPRPPFQMTIHEHPEPPAVATLCVDENELDDWWETLDVEQKADAFTGFSLRMYAGESHVHVCPGERIPVAGAIGDEPEARPLEA